MICCFRMGFLLIRAATAPTAFAVLTVRGTREAGGPVANARNGDHLGREHDAVRDRVRLLGAHPLRAPRRPLDMPLPPSAPTEEHHHPTP
ncbi:unnamed protein product [Nezara viridula]|uniref:Neuropeptide n=1 Tax=Nezara viridula TaxID=85310 RepID=A0A9P0GYR4_NEZVI|nr:unnamed protein product [Nezara viridula]